MCGKSIYDMYIGQTESFDKTITEADIILFAGVTGDMNPVHIDDVYASCSIFHKRVAHGGLVAALFSTVLGTRLPGVGTIYLNQESKFIRPVYIGDTITAKVVVRELDVEKNRAVFDTIAVNQKGEEVIVGTAVVMPPRQE
ncbi:MAG: MaoC family dehydratase [Acholeplasma sp.]|nr:MaoC family dehydratase [Acholeplasma sp.]